MINGTKPKAATFKLVLAEFEKNPNERYICFVLENLSMRGDISYAQRDACQDYIVAMLSPNISYAGWLDRKHPRVVKKLSEEQYPHALREGRIQWVKHIIEVLES